MYNILVIDDEDIIRRGIKGRIIKFELQIGTIYEAVNGIEAMDTLRDNKIDIALVDINIPFLNGLEFIKEGREISSETTFIIVSGYDKFSYAKKAIEYGVFRYILKPINKEELRAVLEEAIDIKAKGIDKCLEEKNPLINKIENELKNNYHNCNYSLTDLATAVRLSESYISKALKKETGMSFNEYLTSIRINKANEILVAEGKLTTINEVSSRVGYSNQHYFSKVFKKHTGKSPSTLTSNNFRSI